jgi:hypothetical protein
MLGRLVPPPLGRRIHKPVGSRDVSQGAQVSRHARRTQTASTRSSLQLGGSPKHPIWYYNLKAQPSDVVIQDGPPSTTGISDQRPARSMRPTQSGWEAAEESDRA